MTHDYLGPKSWSDETLSCLRKQGNTYISCIPHIDYIRALDAERRLFNSPTRLPFFIANTIIHEALSEYW